LEWVAVVYKQHFNPQTLIKRGIYMINFIYFPQLCCVFLHLHQFSPDTYQTQIHVGAQYLNPLTVETMKKET